MSILYLIYRWLSAIWFLAVLSCSLLDIGRSDDPRHENHYAKWWIDLTNWSLVVCAVQAWLGAMIVTQGLMVDRDDFGNIYINNIHIYCIWHQIQMIHLDELFVFISLNIFLGMQRDVKKGWLHHAYWVLYTVATVYSFMITFSFWTILHDPGGRYWI